MTAAMIAAVITGATIVWVCSQQPDRSDQRRGNPDKQPGGEAEVPHPPWSSEEPAQLAGLDLDHFFLGAHAFAAGAPQPSSRIARLWLIECADDVGVLPTFPPFGADWPAGRYVAPLTRQWQCMT